MKTTTEPNPTEVHAMIKIGIDAHAKRIAAMSARRRLRSVQSKAKGAT